MSPAGTPAVRISRRILERYLLDDETPVVATRQHWAKLVEPVASALLGLLLVSAVSAPLERELGQVTSLLWWLWFALLARALWRLLEWRNEWFVATDRRLLLTYGMITHKVAMMPLRKVTDMNYGRSLMGRLLGYGRFVLESAGQDQAMREINWLPDPDEKYRRICATIFGPEGRDPEDGPTSPYGAADAFTEDVEEDPFETTFTDGPSIADRFDTDVVRFGDHDRESRPLPPRWVPVEREDLPHDWDWVDEDGEPDGGGWTASGDPDDDGPHDDPDDDPRGPSGRRPRLRVVTPDRDPTGPLPRPRR